MAVKRVDSNELMAKMPVSAEEFKDLANRIQEFERDLTPGQRDVVSEMVRPLHSPYVSGTPELDAATVSQLFGDAASRDDIQKFLHQHAGIAPSQPVASLVSLAVSAAFEC